MSSSGQTKGKQIRQPVTEADMRAYEREWTKMMITIWREQILLLGIVDTMHLYRDIQGAISGNDQITIAHTFMEYGIYQADGVGNGYKKGAKNGGDLMILNKSVRKKEKLDKPRPRGPKGSTKHMSSGKPRKKRDWFARKYLRSIYVLGCVERDLYGEAYLGTLSNVVRDMFATIKDESNKLRNM